jgi:multidrug efflux pump subunit AcrA (membrane-fusion protein)
LAAPSARKVALWREYIVRFKTLERVEVRARVSGFVEKVHFRDGQMIQQGDLLFTIDRRSCELKVETSRRDGRENPNSVQVRLIDKTEWKREGRMDFADNQVNTARPRCTARQPPTTKAVAGVRGTPGA